MMTNRSVLIRNRFRLRSSEINRKGSYDTFFKIQWYPREDLNIWCTGLHQEVLQRIKTEEDEDVLDTLYDLELNRCHIDFPYLGY